MKIAIVHPWFIELGGGEKVIESLASVYPQADIFVLAADDHKIPQSLRGRNIYRSPLDKIFRYRGKLKRTCFMPLFPWAVESLDVSRYDVVISSCGPAVMGVNPSQDALHISYIHSPQRAWWDLYADRQASMGKISRNIFVAMASQMRLWEFSAMQRVDQVVANSQFIANRTKKYFRRESTVIYPPVNTARGYIADKPKDYYLYLSRLDIDKGIEHLIAACNRLGRRLLIGGTGRAEKMLKQLAGPTIEFLGYVPDEKVPELYANCRAFLFASLEDFGIAPVEAQSYGRPVIAYGRGGNLETVRVANHQGLPDTGLYFMEQSEDAVVNAIKQFEENEGLFDAMAIKNHANDFSDAVFKTRISEYIQKKFTDMRGSNGQ
jgi:glycosyltransferase involved in cell wall biosynthesis